MSFPWSKPAEKEPEKKPPPVPEEDPPIASELTPEEQSNQRSSAIRAKLKEDLRHKTQPGNHFSYEKIFRPVSRVLFEGGGEGGEGVSLSAARQTMNMSVTSKYHIQNPQTSAWEVTLQMHGFTDFVSATFSTLNRYQLMYQRVFKSGALAVGQWMVQPGMPSPNGVPMGNFFGLVEYPWRNHGCSAVTYLKGQHVSVSHTERLIRGVYVGSTMTYDMNTHDTNSAYAVQSTSADRKTVVALEVKDSGDVKLGLVRKDWATDSEFALEVDHAERKNGVKSSTMNAGIRKNMIGGGVLSLSLGNFSKVKGSLDLPFGLDRPGLNQVRVSYNLNYDLATSTVKHGLSFTI